jgi:hypothetical protein
VEELQPQLVVLASTTVALRTKAKTVIKNRFCPFIEQPVDKEATMDIRQHVVSEQMFQNFIERLRKGDAVFDHGCIVQRVEVLSR